LGILLVHASTHGVACSNVLHLLEDRDMEMKDPCVEQLSAQYRFLKAELEKENNLFELIRKQHARTVSQLADDITKKFFELKQAEIKSRQESNRERI
jgi:superfamily I DNA and RNA helicase